MRVELDFGASPLGRKVFEGEWDTMSVRVKRDGQRWTWVVNAKTPTMQTTTYSGGYEPPRMDRGECQSGVKSLITFAIKSIFRR